MFAWLILSSFQFVFFFGSVKMIFTKHLLNEEMVDVEIVDKNFLIS